MAEIKWACAAQHALAVVRANKEKKALEAANKGEALALKLDAAAARRQHDVSERPTPRFRVYNDCKVLAAQKRLALEMAMNQATEKRNAVLAGVQSKAHACNAKAAAIADKLKAEARGDPEASAALYERMVNAQVNRLVALKSKYAALTRQTDATTNVIVVRMDDVLPPRAPPAKLIE